MNILFLSSESDNGGLHVLECGQEDCKHDTAGGGCSNDSPLPGWFLTFKKIYLAF